MDRIPGLHRFSLIVLAVGVVLGMTIEAAYHHFHADDPVVLKSLGWEHKRFKELVDFEEKCARHAQKLKRWNEAEIQVDVTDLPRPLIVRMLETKAIVKETIDILQQPP